MRATIRTPWAASLLLGAVMAALIVTPALAAARYQPDGLIRFATAGCSGCPSHTYHGPWLGNNIYNATGAHQTAVWTQGPGSAFLSGDYYTFGISIQNDGSAADRFKVKATGAASAWTVTYARGSTNITSAVVAGTYRTPSLAPGATYLISARMTINFSPNLSENLTRLVTIRSVANSTKLDAVKFGSHL
jgi:opacity protein-like surface antigen